MTYDVIANGLMPEHDRVMRDGLHLASIGNYIIQEALGPTVTYSPTHEVVQ